MTTPSARAYHETVAEQVPVTRTNRGHPTMKPKRRSGKPLPGLGLCALIAAGTSPALGQATDTSAGPAPAPTSARGGGEVELPGIVVIGKRASLVSAQAIKRNAIGIVDSVIADDIQKLPDFSVTDALQRITGIQIARDRGDGGAVAIRGLTQMETTLNGREVFTAGTGRNLNFADIPAEMVAGIHVHKTSSADLIEGGIGGLIDLRTRRPFDFAGREVAASARLIHGDLVDRSKAQFSALASNRWKIDGAGEFGVLLNLSHQERAWREDQKSDGNLIKRTDDLVPGQTITAPNGTSETTSLGLRTRTAGTVILQWRPSDALEFYAEGSTARFKTRQDSHQINVSPLPDDKNPNTAPPMVAGSLTLFPGTNDLKSITWTSAPVSILSFARDTVDRTQQLALGGVWTHEALTLKADLSRTRSTNTLFYSGMSLAGTAANFTHDLSSRVPGTSIAGTDLLDPSNLRIASVLYRALQFEGDLNTARVDGAYRLSGDVLRTVSAGLRLAKRGATNAPGLIFADAAVSGLSAADRPQYVMPNPFTDYFPGAGAPSIGSFLVGNLTTARDAQVLRDAFGVTAPIPSAASPLGIWNIDESTRAAYLVASFETAGTALDGNAGLRVVSSRTAVSGGQSVPINGTVVPIALDSSYTDVLPSVNLRYQLKEGLTLRAAASKTITRPNFDQLSPSLTLIRNTVNPALNQGSAGNPELKPIRSDNLDVALESYVNPTTSVTITGFLKKVDGFVTTVSSPEIHDGVAYQVSRPQNTAPADIKGFELGYQQFFDFLPGWLNGTGLQANYTYVDSETPNSAVCDKKVPLQNLSKHSYNVIALYEKAGVSARLAYNWRNRFLSSIANVVGECAQPVYTRSYGWLDASASYRFNDRFSVSIEGTNLLRTIRRSYYGVDSRPESNWINDRQISLTASFRL